MIGLISGVILVASVYFVEHKLKIDDPVGAISVHGVNGAFGVLSVGLFADGSYGAGLNGVATPVIGLFYGGGFSQLIAQSIGTVTCAHLCLYFVLRLLQSCRQNTWQSRVGGRRDRRVGSGRSWSTRLSGFHVAASVVYG